MDKDIVEESINQAVATYNQPLTEFVGLSPDMAMLKAKESVKALIKVIKAKPQPLIINGKQYLEFSDWQLIGLYFGVMVKTIQYKELFEMEEQIVPATGELFSVRTFAGYSVEASAVKNGQIITTAIAECTIHEKSWKNKERNHLLQMAQVRAQRAALKNALRWVFSFARVDIPEAKDIESEDDPESLGSLFNNNEKGG